MPKMAAHDLRDVARDMHDRWRPAPLTMRVAAAMLAAAPAAHAVIVPLALPGKHHGQWTVGQEVEHVPAYFLATDRGDSYRAARDAASRAADEHLGRRNGQPCYAVIRRNGEASMFEDMRGL